MKPLNIDALERSDRSIELRGVTYEMIAITPKIAMICDAATEADGVERLTLFIDAVCALLPTMKREVAETLSMAQIGAIVAHATREVAAVEEAAADPNADRPTSTASGETGAT